MSLNWLKDFSKIVTFPVALVIISGIAYVPGYLNAFLVVSLLLDRQPPFKNEYPSKDITIHIAATNAIAAAEDLNIDVEVIREEKPGKFNALNKGLKYTMTDLVITLDADTLLHKSAVRYLVACIESAADDVCVVAGSVLVRNSRDNILTRIQEWDYFLGIASIKR